MSSAFSLKEMFLLGWPILSLLLLCSVISLAIILERWVYFRRRRVDVKDFLSKIEVIASSKKEPASQCAILGEPLSSLCRAAFAHHGRNGLDLAVDRAVRLQIVEMEHFVPFLGTLAAGAPFIGLLGTVIGIIRAFKSIAISGGTGGPQVVAGGIAEALISTALGLMVAIPALFAYNAFSTKIRRTTESMEICADQLVEMISRGS